MQNNLDVEDQIHNFILHLNKNVPITDTEITK